jgi:hypothetical protein
MTLLISRFHGDQRRVLPLPSKIEAVLQIPVPETITHLRSFLGMCNFFRTHYPLLQRCHRRLQSCSKEAKVDDIDWHGPWNAIMRLHSSRRC